MLGVRGATGLFANMTSPGVSPLGCYLNLDDTQLPLPYNNNSTNANHSPPASSSSSGYTPESETDNKPQMRPSPNGRGRGGGRGRGNGWRNQPNARAGNGYYDQLQRQVSNSSNGRRLMIRQSDGISPQRQHPDISRFHCSNSSANYTPPSSTGSATSAGSFSPGRRHAMAVIRLKEDNWVAHQRFKVKILGLFRGTQTREIYDALSRYGDIQRIEVSRYPKDTAWVEFQ